MIQRHNQNRLTYRSCRDRQVTVTLNQKTFLCRSKSADHDERMIWTIVWSLFFDTTCLKINFRTAPIIMIFNGKVQSKILSHYQTLLTEGYECRNCWHLISWRILARNAFKNFIKLILTPFWNHKCFDKPSNGGFTSSFRSVKQK